MKNIPLFLLTVITNVAAFSQHYSRFTKQLFVQKTDTLLYRILLHDNYDTENKYPFVIFLHGSGERGNDNRKQLYQL